MLAVIYSWGQWRYSVMITTLSMTSRFLRGFEISRCRQRVWYLLETRQISEIGRWQGRLRWEHANLRADSPSRIEKHCRRNQLVRQSLLDDSALLDVGKLYYDYYIRASRSQVKVLCKLMIPKVVRRPRCAGNGSTGRLKESFREDYASGSCLQSLSGFLFPYRVIFSLDSQNLILPPLISTSLSTNFTRRFLHPHRRFAPGRPQL